MDRPARGGGPPCPPRLARLCLALAYADEATAQVQAAGLLVKAPHTKPPIRSPWVQS